jgi:Ser-tRNA(Ala) deacylase AlaX
MDSLDMQHLFRIGLTGTQAALNRAKTEAKPVVKPETTPSAKPAAAPVSAAAKATQYQGVDAGKRTEHTFLTNTWLFQLEDCEVLELLQPGAGKLQVVLKKTIFHPQGGGQPADVGTISAPGLPDLKVSMTTLRKEDGAVLHDCEASEDATAAWTKAVGAKAVCRIDEERRRLAARIHSAGHLLDAAVQAANLHWIPGKGYHFAEGPYVEYVMGESSVKVDFTPKKAAEKEKIIQSIQANIDNLVSSGGAVNVSYVDGMRRVEMAGEECPCGGTHVHDVSEIGKVEIKKLQNKQGNVRLSYTVA